MPQVQQLIDREYLWQKTDRLIDFCEYLWQKRQDTCWPIVTFFCQIFLLVDRHYNWQLKRIWEFIRWNSLINAGSQIFKSKPTFFQNFHRNLSSSSFIWRYSFYNLFPSMNTNRLKGKLCLVINKFLNFD